MSMTKGTDPVACSQQFLSELQPGGPRAQAGKDSSPPETWYPVETQIEVDERGPTKRTTSPVEAGGGNS